ncbi:MAG: 4Fe-4S binding protein, partial [Anaerolineales bacterium]
LTLFERTISSSLLPALDRGITAAEISLYRFPAMQEFIKGFDDLIRPEVLPRTPAPSRAVLLYAGVFIGILALNVVAERFWCRYLCPLGGFLGLLSKVGLVRREVTSECKGCQLCTRSCPTGTIQPEKNYASDPAECTMCLECLDACPRGGISFPARIGLADWQEYDPSRRQALVTFGAAVAGVGLMQLGQLDGKQHLYWIQPPGARENDLLSKCVRCGLCVAVCPTGGLQPAITEAGIEGFWTPVLVPRLGYCNFACNACGEVCPTGAIPALVLDQKQLTVIGRAQIDQNRCLPWSQGIPCIVCEEMCPLPQKAITLEEVVTSDAYGGTHLLQRPIVHHNRCIGCGVCEYKCPAEGVAAIRVQSPQSVQSGHNRQRRGH